MISHAHITFKKNPQNIGTHGPGILRKREGHFCLSAPKLGPAGLICVFGFCGIVQLVRPFVGPTVR